MIEVRLADHSDAHRIAGAFVESWRTTYAGMLPERVLLDLSPAQQEGAWRRSIDRQFGGNFVLVAEDDQGGVVGFANAGRSRIWPLAFAGEIYTLYLLPDYQGQGGGRKLLSAAFARMVEHNVTSAMVWVLAVNPARFFYEAMGAKRVAERHEMRWGVRLREFAYGWTDLGTVLAPGGPLSRVME